MRRRGVLVWMCARSRRGAVKKKRVVVVVLLCVVVRACVREVLSLAACRP